MKQALTAGLFSLPSEPVHVLVIGEPASAKTMARNILLQIQFLALRSSQHSVSTNLHSYNGPSMEMRRTNKKRGIAGGGRGGRRWGTC